MDLQMNECTRDNLCVDCDNDRCIFQGKKESDCPKWRCDIGTDCERCEFIDKNECKECASEHRQLAEWLQELKQLREQTRWILCSEKMPTEHEWVGTKRFGTTISDEVYVTFENPKGERFAEHVRFQNGALSPHMKNEIDSWSKGSKPIAWMPEPKPYMGEGSDKE